MDTGAPFSIGFVTDDEKRDTGGEWIKMEEARKHEFMNAAEKEKLAKAQPVNRTPLRNPNHYPHSTRNLILPNGEIRKVAIRLIRRFNGKVVM